MLNLAGGTRVTDILSTNTPKILTENSDTSLSKKCPVPGGMGNVIAGTNGDKVKIEVKMN